MKHKKTPVLEYGQADSGYWVFPQEMSEIPNNKAPET